MSVGVFSSESMRMRAASSGFGTGVAIAGEYVIVGSLEDEAGASNAGKAYVYIGSA